MIERWLPVVGFEGSYDVSDLGNVRSRARMITEKTGTVRPIKERVLRPGRAKSGHMIVMLGRGNCRYVHSLVLEAFVGPCPDGMECRHGDDIGANNVLENLCWGTRSQNLQDAVRNGRKPVAENHPGAKLTNDDVRAIRSLAGVVQQRDLAGRFGVAGSVVSAIINRKTWKTV